MLGHADSNFSDYIAILKRRLWLIVIPPILGPLAGYLISFLPTPRYTSQSLILVEQPTVPESFVKSLVTSDLVERLAKVQGTILSRSRLQPVIEKYDLYRDEIRRGVAMEDLVDLMRQSTGVSILQDFASQTSAPKSIWSSLSSLFGSTPKPPAAPAATNKKGQQIVAGFSITFSAPQPHMAQQVCTEITSLFIAENIRQREQRAQGTTDFLSNQLAEAKRKLDEQDAKLAEFKRRNFGSLPDERQSNLQMLTTLNAQLGTVAELLNRAEQDKAYAEPMLAQELATWQAAQSGKNPLTLQQQLTKMKDSLAVLEGRYTSDHPDVTKLKTDIAQLEKKLAEQTAAEKGQSVTTKPAEKGLEPQPIQQLRAQLHQAEQLIHIRMQEQERLQQRIKLYESRIQMAPMVEEQFKDLTRDYQTALKFYDDLLANKNQSQMSTELERRQESEQFQILDSASFPGDPSFPNRLLFVAGGFGGALALGLGLALLIEMRDKSLRTERDIKFYLGLPTLVAVPSVGMPASKPKTRKISYV